MSVATFDFLLTCLFVVRCLIGSVRLVSALAIAWFQSHFFNSNTYFPRTDGAQEETMIVFPYMTKNKLGLLTWFILSYYAIGNTIRAPVHKFKVQY